MIQNDNFDLSKFLRNNSLLKEAFEGFNGYKDLEPVKEVDEAAGGMYYVELDSNNFEDAGFKAYLKDKGIKAKIVDPDGPGGPIGRYVASREALRNMIKDIWAKEDPSNARARYSEIKPLQKR